MGRAGLRQNHFADVDVVHLAIRDADKAYASAFPIGATLDVVKRTGQSYQPDSGGSSTWLDREKLRLVSIPSKVALYELRRELDDETLVSDDLETKERKRLQNFERLVEAIGSDKPPEHLLAAHLGIKIE